MVVEGNEGGDEIFGSRRRHAMYWRDWSSGVCSSDLTFQAVHRLEGLLALEPADDAAEGEIGRASCRERVQISVVAVSLKQKYRLSRRGSSPLRNFPQLYATRRSGPHSSPRPCTAYYP